jgi:superfamily II DNA or RNA helicase
MSCCIQNKNITSNLYKKIETELRIFVGDTGEIIELFDTEFERNPSEGDLLHLPFAWARNNISSMTTKHIFSTDLVDSPTGAGRAAASAFGAGHEVATDKVGGTKGVSPTGAGHEVATGFLGELRTEQEEVRNSAYQHLQTTGSTIISAQPGFGKTIVSIELICALNVPALILVKQTTVANQWIESIAKYAPTKRVTKLSSKKFEPCFDIYIANPVLFKEDNNAFFFHRNKLDVLQKIKFLVVDELHQVVSKKNHKAFFKVSPDYFLGLSATPYRPENDPMTKAISLFFGDKIVKTPFFKKHTVYIIKTNFSPQFKINIFTKQLDWNQVLASQATNVSRNRKIIECLKRFPDRIWLVLVKRVEHAKILNEMLKESNLQSSVLTGTTKTFDKNTKILIGTTCKIGTGFDHSPINSLIVASDCVEYFEQFLGRCMRTPTVEPIVVDFEDSFIPLINHLCIRITKYKACGGDIIYENICLPEENQKTNIVIPKRLVVDTV